VSARAAAAEGRCFLCGGLARDVAWRENGHTAVACACGLTFVHPPPGELDPAIDTHPESFYRLPAALKVAWLRRRRAGGRLLEIGCGDGWFLDAARAAGFTAQGLEVAPARARAARRRGHAVIEGRFEDAALEGGYDVVWHCDLLSHFEEPVAALEKMRGLLAPGGALFFEVGVLGGEMRRFYPRVGGLGLPRHRWLYDERALDALVARAGLRVVARKRFGLAPVLWLHAAARLLRGRPRGGGVGGGGAPSRASIALEWLSSLARYRAGALTPGLGPATLLVLAEAA
jgi:SAM-dependent methyltransferase